MGWGGREDTHPSLRAQGHPRFPSWTPSLQRVSPRPSLPGTPPWEGTELKLVTPKETQAEIAPEPYNDLSCNSDHREQSHGHTPKLRDTQIEALVRAWQVRHKVTGTHKITHTKTPQHLQTLTGDTSHHCGSQLPVTSYNAQGAWPARPQQEVAVTPAVKSSVSMMDSSPVPSPLVLQAGHSGSGQAQGLGVPG